MKIRAASLVSLYVASGAWAALPAVPPEVDASKYVIDGDSREIWRYDGYANHSCSYPNDPTTADDVKRQAKESAKDTQYTHALCDTCGGWDPFNFIAAAFCPRAVDGETFTVFEREYPDSGPGGCQDLSFHDGSFKGKTRDIPLGKDNGVYKDYGPDLSDPSVTKCSAQRRPDHCQSHSTPHGRHCHCDPTTCTDSGGIARCCTWEQTTERIDWGYKYWILKNAADATSV